MTAFDEVGMERQHRQVARVRNMLFSATCLSWRSTSRCRLPERWSRGSPFISSRRVGGPARRLSGHWFRFADRQVDVALLSMLFQLSKWVHVNSNMDAV